MKRFSVYLVYRDKDSAPVEKQFHGASIRSLMKMAALTIEDDLGLGRLPASTGQVIWNGFRPKVETV